jgi:hypothetical protein
MAVPYCMYVGVLPVRCGGVLLCSLWILASNLVEFSLAATRAGVEVYCRQPRLRSLKTYFRPYPELDEFRGIDDCMQF